MRNLILIHGWAADGRIWEHQRTALGGRANLWAPDLPGWRADWLADRLKAFDPAETVLVGWSLGGMLALEVCAGGFRPRALITLAACASFCRRPDFGLGVAPAVVRGMRQQLRTDPDQVVQDFHRQLPGPREGLCQEDLQGLLPRKQDPEWLAQGLDYLRSRDLRGLLPQVEAEALVIVHGERDRITEPAQATFLQEQLPAARLVRLPATGHVPMVSRSRQVNELLADFL